MVDLVALPGPVATIIASFTAVGVTAYFASKQVRIAASQAATAAAQRQIAKSQRDIAYDRLKYDLFEKRYEIYLAAKALIEHVSDLSKSKGRYDQRALELKVKLIEARFFCPPAEAALFADIAQKAALHIIASTTTFTPNLHPETKAKVEDTATNSMMELAQIYEQLPDRLAPVLGFAQLTSRNEEE
jgi:hypothetical protein